MAGDWLKMRHDLADDPAVIRLAAALGIDEDAVVGKLHRLWSWVDRHTTDGRAEGVGLAWVDRKVRCDGFAVEMVAVGWLEETGRGLGFPRFDRHCSDTAKARALTKIRVERHRNAASVTDALPEKRRIPTTTAGACANGPDPAAWATLRAAWNAGPGEPYVPPGPPDEAVERLSEPGWLDAAVLAIGRLRGCRYFETPVPLHQFCGPRFVARVNQGRYDTPKTPKQGRRDDRQPVRVDPEFQARKRATEAKLARDRAEREAARAAPGDDLEDTRAEMLRQLKEATT